MVVRSLVAVTLLLFLGLAGTAVVAIDAQQRASEAVSAQQQLRSDVARLARERRATADALDALGTTAARLTAQQGEADSAMEDLRSELGVLDESVQDAEAKAIDVADVAAEALPSVVVVECGSSMGSGFVLTTQPRDDGTSEVITNHHVVEECADGTAQVGARQGSTVYRTTLVTWDVEHDLALLELQADLPSLDVGATPQQGDPVVAIGAPLGLEESVTSGLVSNNSADASGTFQTDASINPGNSGGPLLDRDARVIGVNTTTAIDTSSVVSTEGISWAVRMRVVCQTVADCGAGG